MNQVRLVEVDEEYAGQRLDNFLQREVKSVPKTRLYRALRKGEVRVNKGRVKADYRVKAGDIVRIPPFHVAEPSEGLTRVPRRWERLIDNGLLYEDAGMWVINKPSGLAVHGGSGLSFGMIECLRLLKPEERYLELVHRLDRDTSGCIMISRRGAVLKDLHRQLREDKMSKTYLALVEGHWSAKRNHVDAPLNKNTLKSGERVVRVEQGGKQARTDFRVLERFANCSLVEARPITGRTHQIRVHALHAGHPILGDEKYGSKESNQKARQAGLKRLFLHASKLAFTDLEGKRREVFAPLEPSLEKYLEKLRK
jgi:23S rRNA pseudouridine955/2504/2580 synthase